MPTTGKGNSLSFDPSGTYPTRERDPSRILEQGSILICVCSGSSAVLVGWSGRAAPKTACQMPFMGLRSVQEKHGFCCPCFLGPNRVALQ